MTAAREPVKHRRTLWSFIGWLGIVALAGSCAPPDNQAACQDYVEAHNQAYRDCGRPDQQRDPDLTCPQTLNDGIDCTQYFETLRDSIRCEDGQVTWDASGSCR